MKTIKVGLVVMTVALMILGLSTTVMAFHDEGVARCAGCHSMHNSEDGAPISETPGGHLLRLADASATCLSCHAAYGQLTTDGSGYGSGGDFYWIKKTFTWTAHGSDRVSPGDSHGHNIIAADYGLFQDQTLTTSPGGSYPASQLSCVSCHDPHGSGGHALILWGTEKAEFANDAPLLVSPGRRTASSNAVSDTNHTAFSSGMSEWCANCHNDFLRGDTMHPVSQNLGTDFATNYDRYVASGDLSGDHATAYWEIVPFEVAPGVELDVTSTVGPTSSAQVMCLSCHRAHASALMDAGRWDFTASFLVEESHPQAGDGGVEGNDVVNSYYGRVFTATQRSLCNKCHVQDEGSGAHG